MVKIFKHPLFYGGIGTILLAIIPFFVQGGFGKMTPLTFLYIIGFVIGIGLIIGSVTYSV